MSSYGKTGNSGVTSINQYTNTSGTYSYTCPSGKRAVVSLYLTAISLSGSSSLSVSEKGVTTYSVSGESPRYDNHNIELTSGDSVSIYVGVAMVANLVINAVEFRV